MTKTLFLDDDAKLLDNPATIVVKQAKTGDENEFTFCQEGAISIREAGMSGGAYRAGDKRIWAPIAFQRTVSGSKFRPGMGDTFTDEDGDVYTILSVLKTNTSNQYAIVGRLPSIATNLADIVNIEKLVSGRTPTGAATKNFVTIHAGLNGAIEPIDGIREWLNEKEKITVTHRLFLESFFDLTAANYAFVNGKRYRILSVSPQQIGAFPSWDVAELGK